MGRFNVTSVAPMTASATFGAPESASGNVVVVGSTVGGTVTGGGEYAPGDTVVLTAQAESGYTKIKSNIRRIEVTLKAGVKDVGKLGAENQIAVAV